jgi:sensor domain CHASE-containing protein
MFLILSLLMAVFAWWLLVSAWSLQQPQIEQVFLVLAQNLQEAVRRVDRLTASFAAREEAYEQIRPLQFIR